MEKCFYNNERERPVREQLHPDDAQLRLRDREEEEDCVDLGELTDRAEVRLDIA